MTQRFYVFLLSLTVFAVACTPSDDAPAPDPSIATRDANMALGNPSGATTAVTNSDNFLMEKDQYTLSYNETKGTANWVSWHLSTAWLGSADRQDDFRADPNLPPNWYAVQGNSYTGSGFDRGHICPSADRVGSINDNSATFLMTNMMPQAPDNNQQTWADLEAYARTLANAGNELYIIAGPNGEGGQNFNNQFFNTINNGHIVVPRWTWKIAVVLPNGSSDISRINNNTRVIAVKMPNTQTVDIENWGYYRVSVDELETLTGYDFLSNVPVSIQTAIEARVDNGPIQ